MARSRSIGGIFASLSLKDGKFSASLKRAKKQLVAFAAGAAKIGVASIGVGIAVAMKKASEAETMQAQLSSLLKSDEAAKDLIKTLRKLNVESPLSMEDFTAGAKQLLGVRMGVDDTVDSLDRLSNISMGNSGNFESIVRAFGQVRSAGRLMGQEVLQFVNAGFNPLAEISEMTGESMASLKKRMEAGKISFDEVTKAIKHATDAGGIFNGMNAKIAGTFEGKINMMKENFNQFLIGVGTAINNGIKPQLDKLNMVDFSGMGQKLGDAITIGIAGLTDTRFWDSFTLNGLAAIVDLAKSLGDYFSATINAISDEFANAFDPSGNKGLLAMKAFGRDLMTMGAGSDARKAAMDKNREEWEYSQNFNRPSFAENFDKYLNATKNEKSPLAESMRKESEDLWYEFRAQMARDLEATPKGTTGPAREGSEIIADMMKEAKISKTPSFEAARNEVNEYQRRGLSLNSEDAMAPKVDKQTNLLTEIRDGIRRLSDRPKALTF